MDLHTTEKWHAHQVQSKRPDLLWFMAYLIGFVGRGTGTGEPERRGCQVSAGSDLQSCRITPPRHTSHVLIPLTVLSSCLMLSRIHPACFTRNRMTILVMLLFPSCNIQIILLGGNDSGQLVHETGDGCDQVKSYIVTPGASTIPMSSS